MKMSAAVVYHDQIAGCWSKGYKKKSFKKRLKIIESILENKVEEGARWLDLGCGSGVITKVLLSLGANVTAVDGSPKMLSYLEKSYHYMIGQRLAILKSDVTNIPYIEDAAIDGVLCSSVIEYIEYPGRLLMEVFRVLRPGGILIISVPPKKALVRELQCIIKRMFSEIDISVYSYLDVSCYEIEPENINKWFEEYGFYLDKIYTYDPVIPLCLQKYIRPSLFIINAYKK